MLELTTPRGLPVQVPETPAEDPSPRFNCDQLAAIRDYYQENGYVIVGKLFEPGTCDRQRSLWEKEVKPYSGYIYRQATARAEKHVFNTNGWVMNPILNLQSIDPRHFPQFRDHSTQAVLASPKLRDIFAGLFGEPPKIVQSMYFEGNAVTWEHQDSYYLDSEKIGEMAAAWIAIEDISAKAGRFFVCPGSHKLKLDAHGMDNNIAEHHEIYISSVVDKIKKMNLEIKAPALQKGDVLFWNAFTIHGSLNTQRSSVLAFFGDLPRDTEFAPVSAPPNPIVGRRDRHGERDEDFSPERSRCPQEPGHLPGRDSFPIALLLGQT